MFNGGPGREPISSREFTQWRALIEVVEPYEQEQAQAKNKTR